MRWADVPTCTPEDIQQRQAERIASIQIEESKQVFTRRGYPVAMLDKGKVKQVFRNGVDAAIALGLSNRTRVHSAINRGITAGGYYWRRATKAEALAAGFTEQDCLFDADSSDTPTPQSGAQQG